MVGGRDWWGDARFGRVNLATGAGGGGRPSGSAFKTFALVAALERGIPPEAVFQAPDRLVVGRAGRRGPDWRVANYEGHGFGEATLRSATALSINTVYAGLLLRLGGGDADRGARAVVEAAARMGMASPLRAVPSAVLGTGEVTPLEMAAGYATLAARGRRAAPGTVLAQAPAGGAARAAGAPVELTVAVDGQGAGGLGVTLVPEVLGQPEAAARQLLSGAGLDAEVLAGCDADPARATEPGRVWRSVPAPGARPPPAPGSACGPTPGLPTADHDHHPPGSVHHEPRRALAASHEQEARGRR
jgi:hypothetical protein